MSTGRDTARKRLAIIGAGSSGLVTLKFAVDLLPGWEIVCFEKSSETTGAWGNPYKGFVSTSSKYATQFACYRKFDSQVHPEGKAVSHEFFNDEEYGKYLESFVEHFQLGRFIVKNCAVAQVRKDPGGWRLWMGRDVVEQEVFDRLIICTGLAEKPKTIDAPVPLLPALDEDHPVARKKIVVLGGGETATDIANRLADPSLENKVWLSLKSGVRVSPRYHPIRSVPSDFLRNRFLLSIHEDIRNAVGQKFVEARIKHREKFERFFGSSKTEGSETQIEIDRWRKHWDAKLTERAKDDLFNMFHNKSDDFLDAVGAGRIEIIGGNCDGSFKVFSDFDEFKNMRIDPDYLVPSIGYESNLRAISGGDLHIRDFFLGCIHGEYDDLYLIGFARPIIGNIPTISEMQARYVIGQIAGDFERPWEIASRITCERKILETKYPKLNIDALYPVEMIPYCDQLAKKMGSFPSLWRVKSPTRWLRILLSPASTLHYVNEDYDPKFIDAQKIHSPIVVTILLCLIKLFDIPFKLYRKIFPKRLERPPHPPIG